MQNNQEQIQKAFMAFLIEDAAQQGVEIQSEQDLQAYAEELGKEGLQAKYQQFMQKMQGGVKARLGAKLNYIKSIKNDCPDGYEKFYFKSGGQIKSECRVCNAKKAMQSGGEVKKNPVEKFKSERDQYKKDMLRYKNDKAAQDSIKANKYNDQEVQTSDKGSYKNGKWVPDRSKYKMLKSACGSKMKKKK